MIQLAISFVPRWMLEQSLGRPLQIIKQQVGEQEVPQMVGPKSQLKAVGGPGLFTGERTSGMVD